MRTPLTLLALFAVFALSDLAVAQDTTRVSVDSGGAEGDNFSGLGLTFGATSADGNVVAFWSSASNLVSGDTNGWADVFVHDRSTGLTDRVSVDSAGGEGNLQSTSATISTDGRFVVFVSGASNLVTGDKNGYADVFVHDRTTKITERVSVDSAGKEGNNASGGGSDPVSISADGRYVAFTSDASNLVVGDTNVFRDVFVHDRTNRTTVRVSVDSTGAQAKLGGHCGAISADGNVVAFYSASPDLVASDTNLTFDAFVHELTSGITERVSVDSSEAEGTNSSNAAAIAISPDGSRVVFVSYAINLVSGDTNGFQDIFLRDRSAGTTELVSVDSSGVQTNRDSWGPTMSADARFIAFVSMATNLVVGDTNGWNDVFVHDRATGTTERVSVGTSGGEATAESRDASISADGEVVTFASSADNLVSGDSNGTQDVFARDRCDAYWSNYGAGFPGTNGVPALTCQTDPVLGTTVTVDLANSFGSDTTGLLFIGFSRLQLHSSLGGDLLVDPTLVMFVAIPAAGLPTSDVLADDEALCGLEIDLQAVELDPGAARGVSFTAGLELVLGR